MLKIILVKFSGYNFFAVILKSDRFVVLDTDEAGSVANLAVNLEFLVFNDDGLDVVVDCTEIVAAELGQKVRNKDHVIC